MALRAGALTLAYSVLTVVFTWPLAAYIGERVVASVDPVDSIWRVGWGQERLLHAPWLLFNGNTYYPYPRSYLFDELLLGAALLTLPLRLFTQNPVAIYNLAVLSSFVLSALGMWALARRLGCHPAGAFAAGLIYAFAPLHMVHFSQFSGHLGLLSGQYFPVIVLLLDQIFECPRWRTAFALAAALAMQALSAQYYAYYLIFVVGGFLALRLAQEGLQRRFPGRAVWSRLILAGALAGLIFLPFAVGYRMVQQEYGLRRPLDETVLFSANLASFVTADSQAWLWGQLTAPLRIPAHYYIGARNLFPGLAALVLALVGVLATLRQPLTQYLALLGAGGAILALGPVLSLTGNPASQLFAPMPYQYLHAYFPGFDSMRVPARFGILYGLSVAALAGCGLTWLMARVAARRGGRVSPRAAATALACAVIAVICAESVNRPFRLTTLQTGDRVPPVYTWLASQPGAVVIEFPFLAPTGDQEIAVNTRYQYFSLYHRRPLVNGSAGVVPKGYATLAQEVTYGPTRRTLSIMEGLGVTHLVVHYDQLEKVFGTRIAGLTRTTLNGTPDQVREERAFGPDVVYRLIDSGRFARLRATIPLDATIYLSREDPLGTYGGMIGWVLRENRIYTTVRVHFGQKYAGRPRPDAHYDYAVLYHHEDPRQVGLAYAEVVWEDEVVRVYRALPHAAPADPVPTAATGGTIAISSAGATFAGSRLELAVQADGHGEPAPRRLGRGGVR